MRLAGLVVTLFLVVSCATVSANPPLPCSDNDAERCLAFLKLVEDDDKGVLPTLERYCLEGNTAACRELARRRRDNNLAQLCTEGVEEACELTPDKKSDVLNRVDCIERHNRAACEAILGRVNYSEEADVLEAGCSVGLARSCFALATALRVINPTDERAKSLNWRACLAGVADACLTSEVNETRCKNGSSAACRAFQLAAGDVGSVRTHKIEVLKAACHAGELYACDTLVEAISLDEVVALSCDKPAPCARVLNHVPLEGLVARCDTARLGSIEHDAACRTAAYLACRSSENLATSVERWLVAHAGAEADLLFEVRVNQNRRLEGLRERCRAAKLGAPGHWVRACDETNLKGIAAVDSCLQAPNRQSCALATLWVRGASSFEPEVTLRVMASACTLGEAMFCVPASEVAKTEGERRALLEEGCRLKNGDACALDAKWKNAENACANGHCASYAELAKYSDEAVTRLVNSCVKGDVRDCAAWRGHFRARYSNADRPLYWANEVIRHPQLSDVKGQPEALAACETGAPTGCGAFIYLLGGENGSVVEDQATLVSWASNACRNRDDLGCLKWADLDAPHQTEALASSCALNNGDSCGKQAENLWQTIANTRVDALGPDAVTARALAVKGCDLESRLSCSLASNFFESGIGGPADPLESARFQNRAETIRR